MIMVDFAFEKGQRVWAMDYDDPPKEHLGLVVRRWVEERPLWMVAEMPTSDFVVFYWVVLHEREKNGPGNYCEFLESDLRPADNEGETWT